MALASVQRIRKSAMVPGQQQGLVEELADFATS